MLDANGGNPDVPVTQVTTRGDVGHQIDAGKYSGAMATLAGCGTRRDSSYAPLGLSECGSGVSWGGFPLSENPVSRDVAQAFREYNRAMPSLWVKGRISKFGYSEITINDVLGEVGRAIGRHPCESSANRHSEDTFVLKTKKGMYVVCRLCCRTLGLPLPPQPFAKKRK